MVYRENTTLDPIIANEDGYIDPNQFNEQNKINNKTYFKEVPEEEK
jgi:hypothetical protein